LPNLPYSPNLPNLHPNLPNSTHASTAQKQISYSAIISTCKNWESPAFA
jgi:hypothetical protein